jgi:aspartyl/asparaginyl-tRNA synthetase
MQRTLIANLPAHLGQPVKIQGWLQTLRDQKKMAFLIVRDLSGTVQVVFEKKDDPLLAERISALTRESAITLIGTALANPIVKLGGLEVALESLAAANPAASPLPFDPFAATLPDSDYRMDWRYMDLRLEPLNFYLDFFRYGCPPHEGRQRQAQFKNGVYHDILIMSILRQEWNPPA